MIRSIHTLLVSEAELALLRAARVLMLSVRRRRDGRYLVRIHRDDWEDALRALPGRAAA